MEQEFNSLHAQRESCVAYIASQKHEGWQMIKTHYDDGGFSGGNMERPALKQLLADIDARKVDIIVVYKVDRLSRSLHDFAKMVEVFDKHSVSFVSVTQQFNTTTSMGRLTLNVLLSFAQFEREVTGERIRDKIAASKKKGMWMGGPVPLGYEVNERKLIIKPTAAETVRQIYQRYLELGCVRLLQEYLVIHDIRSASDNMISRGALYKMLSNPIYIGLMPHKGVCHPGEHEAIVDQELWERVQQHLTNNRIGVKTVARKTDSCPLTHKLFDASGERLVPVHALKKGRRYRYYILQSLTAAPKDASSNGWRLPGQEIEQIIAHAAVQILQDGDAVTTSLQAAGVPAHHMPTVLIAARKIDTKTPDIIERFIQRVEIRQDGIHIILTIVSLMPADQSNIQSSSPPVIVRDIPMQMKRRGVEMRLMIGGVGLAKVDHTLLKTIARAHQWFDDLSTGRIKNMAEIAAQEHTNKSYVARVIRLAFIAPDITESIIAGRQPADLSVEKLTKQMDLPLDWSQQRQLLGFA